MPGWVSYLALQASLADRNQLFYRKGYFEYVLPLIRVGVSPILYGKDEQPLDVDPQALLRANQTIAVTRIIF